MSWINLHQKTRSFIQAGLKFSFGSDIMIRGLSFERQDPLASQFQPQIPLFLEGKQIVSGLHN